MNEVFKINKRNIRVIIIHVVALILGLTLVNLFVHTSSVSFQHKLIRLIVFDIETVQFTDTEISKGIKFILYQMIFILFYTGMLKILRIQNKQIGLLLMTSTFILLASIVLGNLSFPYYKRIQPVDIIPNIETTIRGIFFIHYQLRIYILLSIAFAPIASTFIGLQKKISPKNLIIPFGLFFLIAGIITPPDIVTQVITGIIISFFWFIGFLIAKLFKKRNTNIAENNTKKLYSLIILTVQIILLLLTDIGETSFFEIIITVSVLMFIQNLTIVVNIYDTDKLSSLLCLIIPFYLPYYILKNIKKVYNDKLFFKIYSGILIIFTIIKILISY